MVIPNKDSNFVTEFQSICQTLKTIKTMKKKIIFTIGAMLLFCSLTFAQNGGIPVGKEVNITPTSGGGYLKINIENLDGCQPNNTSSYSYFVAPLIQMQYNNPASGTLNIQIIEQNNNSRTLSSETNYYSGEYNLELYDQNTTLVRKINCKENTPQIQIPVSDLMPGYYYLRLIINSQIIEIKQIIIN